MAKWSETTKKKEYQSLPPELQLELKKRWFNKYLAPEVAGNPTLAKLGQEKAFQWFMQKPDDSGQGLASSMVGAAARGFADVVPGVIGGAGALIGSEGLRKAGQSVRRGIESVAPVNPIYADSYFTKIPGVAGQVASVILLGICFFIARNLLFHPFRILGTLGPGKEGVQGEVGDD